MNPSPATKLSLDDNIKIFRIESKKYDFARIVFQFSLRNLNSTSQRESKRPK